MSLPSSPYAKGIPQEVLQSIISGLLLSSTPKLEPIYLTLAAWFSPFFIIEESIRLYSICNQDYDKKLLLLRNLNSLLEKIFETHLTHTYFLHLKEDSFEKVLDKLLTPLNKILREDLPIFFTSTNLCASPASFPDFKQTCMIAHKIYLSGIFTDLINKLLFIDKTHKENLETLENFFSDKLFKLTKQKADRAAYAMAQDLKKITACTFLNLNLNEIYLTDADERISFKEANIIGDKIATMVSRDLLNSITPFHQERIALFYLEVIRFSLIEGDYFSALSILLAFDTAALGRLHPLKNLTVLQERLAHFKDLFGYAEANPCGLRNFINIQIIVVPPPSIYNKDITFFHEGNPDITSSSKQLNLIKAEQLLKLTRWFERRKRRIAIDYEKGIPPFTFNLLHRLDTIDCDGDKDYESSLKWQPKPIKITKASLLYFLHETSFLCLPPFLEIEWENNRYYQEAAYEKLLFLLRELTLPFNSPLHTQRLKLIELMKERADKSNFQCPKLNRLFHQCQKDWGTKIASSNSLLFYFSSSARLPFSVRKKCKSTNLTQSQKCKR